MLIFNKVYNTVQIYHFQLKMQNKYEKNGLILQNMFSPNCEV